MQRRHSRMTGAGLEGFIERWNLTREQAAQALGLNKRMIYWYLAGTVPISRALAVQIHTLNELWELRTWLRKAIHKPNGDLRALIRDRLGDEEDEV